MNGKKDENSESSKLQFSMTTDAAPNVNKRFTALNFIISVQYKTNIYTVLYCADYISALPHPFHTKKVEVDFFKKSRFVDFRGQKK